MFQSNSETPDTRISTPSSEKSKFAQPLPYVRFDHAGLSSNYAEDGTLRHGRHKLPVLIASEREAPVEKLVARTLKSGDRRSIRFELALRELQQVVVANMADPLQRERMLPPDGEQYSRFQLDMRARIEALEAQGADSRDVKKDRLVTACKQVIDCSEHLKDGYAVDMVVRLVVKLAQQAATNPAQESEIGGRC